MSGFSHWMLLAAGALAVVACSAPPPPPPPAIPLHAPGGRAQSEQLGRLVERYWADAAALTPWYSWGADYLQQGFAAGENIAPQSLADALAVERRYLAEVHDIPRQALDARSQLTYDMFVRGRELAIEGFTYPAELLPVNPYESMPWAFAVMASGAERLALAGERDCERWQARALGFERWTDQAIVNMRDGMRRGYTLPRVLVEETLPQLAALAVESPGNPFWQALRAAPGGDGARSGRCGDAIRGVLNEHIQPSYRKLHEFLQQEYLPRARSSTSLAVLPLGDAWYAYLLKRATGGTQDATELHAQGLAEVLRLRQRIASLLAETAFAGDAAAYLQRLRTDPRFAVADADALLQAYQDLKVQVAAAAPGLLGAMPRADFAIRDIEEFRAASAAPLAYLPRAPNGMLPAVLYVDLRNPQLLPAAMLPAEYLRAAVPGRHYQEEWQRERGDLPRFRRFGREPAFAAGWALYATTLGEALGVYKEPENKFAALLLQLDCAARLVVDTGLHAKGWSRGQALDYLQAQLPLDPARSAVVVDRALALPGEAAACTVGFLKIQALRSHAEQKLGGAFDARAFHAELVGDGAMPLDLLERRMGNWLDAAVAAPAKLD